MERAICRDGDAEHDEAPEGKDVCDTGHEPLQQFLLSEDLNSFGAGTTRQVTGAVNRGLAGANEGIEEKCAAHGKGQGYDDDRRAEAETEDIHSIHGVRVTLVCQDGSPHRHLTSDI